MNPNPVPETAETKKFVESLAYLTRCLDQLPVNATNEHLQHTLRSADEGQSRIWALMVVLACTLMIKFKLSYLIFGAVIVALVHVLVLVRDNFKIQKGLIILVCLSGVLFVPWLARGYITSGYPFYPEAFLGLRVDWRVPAQNANGLKKVIYSFARDPTKLPDQVLGNNDWLGPWIERNAKDPANIRAFLLISTGLISFILSLLIRSSPEIRFLQLFVLAPGIAWKR